MEGRGREAVKPGAGGRGGLSGRCVVDVDGQPGWGVGYQQHLHHLRPDEIKECHSF